MQELSLQLGDGLTFKEGETVCPQFPLAIDGVLA